MPRGKGKIMVEKTVPCSRGRRCDCNAGLSSIKLMDDDTPKTWPRSLQLITWCQIQFL